MTTKQFAGCTAPDSSQYVTLTDGNGNIVTPGGGGSGTVTSVSVTTANGVSGTVATATTTPAISVALGAITPTSVAIGGGGVITSSGVGGGLGSAAFTNINIINPVTGNNAAGIATTTTGSITISTNSLVVASATGWSVGMGIAVAGAGSGGSGGTELVTTVNTIVGTTFTLASNATATVTGAVVNYDDTAALNNAFTAAIATGLPVHLPAGTYNVSSGITVSTPIYLYGDGVSQTTIQNRSKTASVFTLNGNDANNYYTWRDFRVLQASGVTPTAGYAFAIGPAGGDGQYVLARLSNIYVCNTWAGISITNGVDQSSFRDMFILGMVGGQSVLYNNVEPYGDNDFDNFVVNSETAGLNGIIGAFYIFNADTTTFTNLKLLNSTLGLYPQNGSNVNRVRFINPSFEGGQTYGIIVDNAGSGTISDIQFIGGGMGGFSTGVIEYAIPLPGISFIGTMFYNISGVVEGPVLQLNGPKYTVSTLPAVTSNLLGLRAFVTDALSPVFGSTVTGGGSVICPVFCTGAAWICG